MTKFNYYCQCQYEDKHAFPFCKKCGGCGFTEEERNEQERLNKIRSVLDTEDAFYKYITKEKLKEKETYELITEEFKNNWNKTTFFIEDPNKKEKKK